MTGTVKTTKEPLFHVVKHAERTGRGRSASGCWRWP